MVLCIVILVFVMFLGWILFAPLILAVNTGSEQYSARLPGIFKARFVRDEESYHVRIRVFFIPFTMHPYGFAGKGQRKPKGRKPRRTGSVKYGIMAFRELLKSFRLKLLYLNIDSGDYLLNAFMVPVLMFTRSERIRIRVNFMEENTLVMDLRNRLASLLWIGIKYKYRMLNPKF